MSSIDTLGLICFIECWKSSSWSGRTCQDPEGQSVVCCPCFEMHIQGLQNPSNTVVDLRAQYLPYMEGTEL